jgi:hypothetical protein
MPVANGAAAIGWRIYEERVTAAALRLPRLVRGYSHPPPTGRLNQGVSRADGRQYPPFNQADHFDQ